MGIKNLLPQLEGIMRDCHLKDFAGQRAAIDAYVWIHRGILAVTTELALGRPTTAYVEYVMKQVDSFASYFHRDAQSQTNCHISYSFFTL